MRIYVSTPINGRKEPTFKEKWEAARRRAIMLKAYLREEYPDAEIVTPFDISTIGSTTTEEQAIGMCITAVLESDAILFDRGWTASKGCNLEYRAAKLYKKEIIDGNGQL